MKRFMLLMAALAALTVALSSANARTDGTDQARSICHRTGSATRPYVKVRVSARQLRAHTNHPADIIPAPAGACPKTLLAANGGTAFNITLVGNVESPAGDPVATGTATVRLRAGQGQVCYRVSADNLGGAAVAMHIHKGAAGTRRAGGDPARDAERGRQGRRVRRCVPGTRRADPRLAGGVLPERPHSGVPGAARSAGS